MTNIPIISAEVCCVVDAVACAWGVFLLWRVLTRRSRLLALRVSQGQPSDGGVCARGVPVGSFREATSRGLASFARTRTAANLLTLCAPVWEIVGSTQSSVVRRFRLLGRDADVGAFRFHQLLLAVGGLIMGIAVCAPACIHRGTIGIAGLAVVAFLGSVCGAVAWDQQLTWRAKRRQRLIDEEVPDASELLALAVGAGESIPAAIERVARISRSALSDEFHRIVVDIRSGSGNARALEYAVQRNDSPALERLCLTLVSALERGAPLAHILHAQALDLRTASRERLMESGGKKEILMLFPVVFLILPVTVCFALYPGLFALEVVP
ncbi:type II secretion system F family protein [Schaalia sp. ZJ1691]|uniref:type II secretion system F family protein n=1 Tax=Schaalia sp. ZJ1691 TaxID=2709404 RepID=UPI0013EE17A8|nr:type II secretion system F family protein [Schaalia sp. ZJ1691]